MFQTIMDSCSVLILKEAGAEYLQKGCAIFLQFFSNSFLINMKTALSFLNSPGSFTTILFFFFSFSSGFLLKGEGTVRKLIVGLPGRMWGPSVEGLVR